jgi:hypothetical protein
MNEISGFRRSVTGVVLALASVLASAMTPDGPLTSNVPYTVESKTATPEFSPKAGTYTGAQNISIKDTDSGAVIYYTTNGTTPTTSSPQYTGTAIAVGSTETLKALAIAPAYALSAVRSGVYTID